MKYIASLLAIPAILLSGCTSAQVQDHINSPAVQGIISNVEQFAVDFAIDYIKTHLGASRKVSANSAGVQALKAALMEKYNLPSNLAEDEAIAAFAKAK